MKRVFAVLACLLGLVCDAQAKAPNILFAIADDMSHASCYGDSFVKTPNLDSVARRGIRFTQMHTPNSKCAPSRAVMLTGRNPWQLDQAANHQPVWPEKFLSFVESLGDHGYFTGFTGKGWNPGVHPKNRLLTGREYNEIRVDSVPASGIHSYDYADNFGEFLADREDDQPFFFWFGCKEPHRGYEYGSGVKNGKRLDDLDFMPSFWIDGETTRNDILDYALEVEYFDDHLGRILKQIDDAGELENTLVVVTSDNGMPFPRYKGHTHEFATRVPFVVSFPGEIVHPGRVCDDLTSTIDLAPTLLSVAGVASDESGMQPMQGRSLEDVFADQSEGRDRVLSGRERNDMCRPNGWGYPVRGLRRGAYLYLRNFKPERWPCGTPEAGFRDTDWGPTKSELVYKHVGTVAFDLCFGKRPAEELYDVENDPECLQNLAAMPEYAVPLKKLRQELFEELTAQEDPRVIGDGDIFDRYRPDRIPQYGDLVKKTKKPIQMPKNATR
ncbi:Arylsulfatase A [Neorhodopirellula lusitana]|uniref:Arylsulfatase A n=1 Tax=Neorhodopirellula lusitana TaxID=445327 RepID=A0ABY1PUX1_9BACT|nr:sulfatase [Neorhodopirellula lusitana]SMP43775.1 Arylsulfatase A [Neorhodopirellula lusitana]